MSVGDIALLLDGEICSDTFSQVELLAQRLSREGGVGVRVVVCGAIGADGALGRGGGLKSWPAKMGNRVRVFELPGPRAAGAMDAVRLAFSEALAGCSLLHCFSGSLLGILASFVGEKLLPGLCVSLSRWLGEDVVGQLRRLCRRPAMKVVCQSVALQEALVAGGVPAENCSVIQPELAEKERAGQRSAARRMLNVSEDVDLLLTDPEMSPWSNHRQVSWAGAIIGQFNRKLRVLVIGCGEQVEKLRAFDRSLNPPCLGIYPGERFAPEVLYDAADLLVLPATKVVSPLPLLRAARAHLPVVASNSSSFREYLRHEGNALLFGAGLHNAGDSVCRRIRPLATAIVRLLDDGDLAQRLAEQLAKDLGGAFSGVPLLPGYLEIYRGIVSLNLAAPGA